MEHIINPRTGRKITMNGSVWKSLSLDERKQGERLRNLQIGYVVTKVESKAVIKTETKGESKAETKGESKAETKADINVAVKTKISPAEYIANIEKKTQEAAERVLFIIYSRMRDF
jgi:hypothetical protein